RDDLFGKASRLLRGDRALVAAEREGVLVLARILVLLGHSLGRLPHLQGAVHRGHLRIDEAPPQRGVVDRLRSARKTCGRLGHDPGRAGHALDAARDHDLGAARLDLAGRGDGRLHTRAAKTVYGLAGDFDWKAREQKRHPSDVAVVLAGLVGAAEDDVLYLLRVDMRSFAGFLEDDRREVVRSHVLELSAVTAHGGARRGHDHCFRHVPTSWQRAWRESSARPPHTPDSRPAPPAGTTRTPSPPRRST